MTFVSTSVGSLSSIGPLSQESSSSAQTRVLIFWVSHQNMEDYAQDLHELGVTIVPVMDDTSRAWWEGLLYRAMDEFPEFKVKGRDVQRVLGGFGALGNPSSFHHPTIRQFRRKVKRLVIRDLMRAFVKLRFPKYHTRINLEVLFDRLCVRKSSFREPTPESWHRDIYDSEEYRLRDLPQTLPVDAPNLPPLYAKMTMDMIFGGWINLDRRNQYFVGLPATQDDQVAGGGFSKFSESDIKRLGLNERLAQQANKRIGFSLMTDESGNIIVPPGHALVFFQRLIHSVKGGAQPETPALRVFHGFRLTTEESPLFDIEGVVDNGAVPRIPSGQMPPMYSKNHYAAFNSATESYWRNWAGNTFREMCLYHRKVKGNNTDYYTPGSRDDRNKAANKGRYMPSLSEMGLWSDEYRYSREEQAALFPEPLFPS